MIVFFDNACPSCTTFTRVVRMLDWCNAIVFEALRTTQDNPIRATMNKDVAFQQIASYHNGVWTYGFASLFRMMWRLPILWVFVPLGYVLHFTGWGQHMYKLLAVRRKIIPLHCDTHRCRP